MQKLLAAVHAEASPRDWSRGVELARAGAVLLRHQDAAEIVVQVAVKGVPVSPTVTLWPGDDEWSCDCDSKADPCFHVAAAVIALRRAEEAGTALPTSNARAGTVGYRFTRTPDGLRFMRVRVAAGADEQPLSHNLVQLTSGKVEGPAIAVTQADLHVDMALAAFLKPGVMPPPLARKVVPLLAACTDIRLDDQPVAIDPNPVGYHAIIVDDTPGFRVALVRDPAITETFGGGVISRCGDSLRVWAPKPLSPRFAELSAKPPAGQKPGLRVAPDRAAWLVSEFLPALEQELPVVCRSKRLPQLRDGYPPRLRLAVEQSGEALLVTPRIVYGQPIVAHLEADQFIVHGKVLPRRDLAAEAELQALLAGPLAGLRRDERHAAVASAALRLAERLRHVAATHPEHVELHGDAHHAFVRAGTLQPKLSGTGFNLTFATDDGNRRADPAQVLAAWEAGASEVSLLGGGMATLPHDWLERYGPQVALLLASRTGDDNVADHAKPALADLYAALELPEPPDLRGLAAIARDFVGLPAAALPQDLTAELRTYQRQGVDWLCLLRDAGLGAMLADDMGLGKTLQCLCALQGRALIVAPTSVLPNWAAETRKFRPNLRICIYHGPQRQLDTTADVVLTSYAILRLDAQTLAAVAWDVVVLDEAQTIKNPESQVARAAYGLRHARWRVTLSGTPVENRLDELWSQFHFLMPGLLGGRQTFQDRHARPISDGSPGAAARLRQQIKPFLLRRRKHDVARELPSRTEIVLRCELDDRERNVYNAIHAATERDVIAALEAGGSVLQALEALLRLRQAACHSGLVPGQTADRSAKLDLLLAHLDEAVAAGHKALVFSQWTSLLDRIEPLLQRAGLAFLRLDGSTRDRGAVVEQFQADAGPPVLLLSLKAGGTGLNLTAADHVFLLDPWWNPAAEDQAADRAHRIGQTRPVLVHKLIAADTVEERILELQLHKRALAEAALAEGDGSGVSLTRDDLLTLLR